MAEWLSVNWGTLLVCAVLIAVVAAVVIKLVKDKKAGKCACGGNCKHCHGACHTCRKKEDFVNLR